MQAVRFEGNPIISPTNNWWEISATFNPAATIFQNEVFLLYRAIGGDGLSRFGLARSGDGFHFQRFDTPILEAKETTSEERLGIEDPRITKIEDTYYITYTAASVYPADYYQVSKFPPPISHPAPWRIRPSLMTTKDFKDFERKGVLLDIETKDAVLFPEKFSGRFALLHRIYPNVYITFSKNLHDWDDQKVVISPRNGSWDCDRVGAGPPPLRTDQGWLLFYHGVDQQHHYMLGLLLLDLTDPAKVLYRSTEPIFQPETNYEKNGQTPNVVFANGVVETETEYRLYYGAADKVIGVASLAKSELVSIKR